MRIRGVKQVTGNLDKAADAINKGVGDSVRKAAMEVERRAKENQTAHVLSGRLRASIGAEEKEPLLFEVGTNVEYAAAHEFGTSKSGAYPYIEPAVESVRQKYPDLIKEGVRNEIRT